MREKTLLKTMIADTRAFLPFINKGDGASIIAHQCDKLEDALASMRPHELRLSAEILRQLVEHYLESSHFNWEPADDHDFKTEVVYGGMTSSCPRLKERDLLHWEEVIHAPHIIWEARRHTSREEAEAWF